MATAIRQRTEFRLAIIQLWLLPEEEDMEANCDILTSGSMAVSDVRAAGKWV